jgi:Family of unknown function (DUF6083)
MNHDTSSTGRCRSCGARVKWVKTTRGRNMPLNPEPADRTMVVGGEPGNVVLREGIAHVLGEGRSIEPGETMRVPHFASCDGQPKAAQAAERDQKAQSTLRKAGNSSEPAGKERPPAKTLHDVKVTLLRVKAVLGGLVRDIEQIKARS